MKKAIIIFSGYNQRAIIAFLRTLEVNKLEYAIIACLKDDTIFSTAYKDRVLSTRKIRALDLHDIKKSIKAAKKKLRADKYMITPSAEALNRFLLENKKEFERCDCEIPLVSKELYESISDKYKFHEICLRYKIGVPREYKCSEEIKFPYVAKPKKYFSSGNSTYSPIIIFNKKDQRNFLRNFKTDDFYCQQYIEGKSFYLLYYFCRDGNIFKFSQENNVQQPQGKSIIAAISSNYHLTKESLKYEKLFRSLNFFGLVMVEVKQIGNKRYMIEANPRFWGPSQLFVDAGINLFEAFLFDSNMMTKKPFSEKIYRRMTRYFWNGGLEQVKINNGKVAYHNYTEDKFGKEFRQWLAADIYNRKDTRKLFVNKA